MAIRLWIRVDPNGHNQKVEGMRTRLFVSFSLHDDETSAVDHIGTGRTNTSEGVCSRQRVQLERVHGDRKSVV